MTMAKSMVVTAAAAALLAACSPSDPPPATKVADKVSVADLCDSLAHFFADELRAVNLSSAPLQSPDLTVTYGGDCILVDSENGLGAGTYMIRHAPDRPDPTDNVKGFEKSSGHGEEIWIWDWRKNPWYSGSPRVIVATRIGVWNSSLEINAGHTRTADGDLDMADDNLQKAIAYLIDYTKELVEKLPHA